MSRTIKHTITKTWIGWHIGTTDSVFILEQGMFALTLKGAHRKADRLTRRILRDRRRHAEATVASDDQTCPA